MNSFASAHATQRPTRHDVMKASELPLRSSRVHRAPLGRTGVLRRIKLGRHDRFFRPDVERLVRERNDESSG
jgi:hypothetical protein